MDEITRRPSPKTRPLFWSSIIPITKSSASRPSRHWRNWPTWLISRIFCCFTIRAAAPCWTPARLAWSQNPLCPMACAPAVTWSLSAANKLLGGPQAGILCGRADLINRIKGHPLARAVRADKMALAALAVTLTHYLTDRAFTDVPIWRMIARTAAADRGHRPQLGRSSAGQQHCGAGHRGSVYRWRRQLAGRDVTHLAGGYRASRPE